MMRQPLAGVPARLDPHRHYQRAAMLDQHRVIVTSQHMTDVRRGPDGTWHDSTMWDLACSCGMTGWTTSDGLADYLERHTEGRP